MCINYHQYSFVMVDNADLVSAQYSNFPPTSKNFFSSWHCRSASLCSLNLSCYRNTPRSTCVKKRLHPDFWDSTWSCQSPLNLNPPSPIACFLSSTAQQWWFTTERQTIEKKCRVKQSESQSCSALIGRSPVSSLEKQILFTWPNV